MRIACFTPLPPQRSGIADYSAELLPHLAGEMELELFVDDGVRIDAGIRDRFPVHGERAFLGMWNQGRFDAVLIHLGNNPDFHSRAWRTLTDHPEIPSVLVLHEAMLHHLVRGLTLSKGDLEGYVEEMRYAYGRTGQGLARRSVDTGIPLDVWSYPLFERAVDASRAVIVHNEFTRQRVLASRPLARTTVIPHHVSLEELGGMDRASARAALKLPPDAFVLASYGFITPAKRLEVTLRAFARLKKTRSDAIYLLVGEASPHYDLAGLLTPELSDGVVRVGHTELEDFLRYMVAADVAVNLRYPTAGETSGTLIRLLGLGQPVIVSNLGAFAEIPDGACAKVDLDETEEELLTEILQSLAADEGLRRAMGENARRHVKAHTPEASARAYAEVLRGVIEDRPAPFRIVPPLSAYPPGDVLAELAADVSAAAVDLGVGEADDDLLRELAAVLVDLDLDTKRNGVGA